MVVTPDREPNIFGAISHPARRRMLDPLVETDRSVNTMAGQFQMSRLQRIAARKTSMSA